MTDTGRLAVQRRAVVRRRPDPTRLVALLLGGLFTVLGVVTVVRVGVPTSLTSPHVIVGWFHHTPAWGVVLLVLGVGLLAAASEPLPDHRGVAGFGVLAVIFGAVVLVEPDVFHAALGIHDDTGWLFVATGLVALAAPMLPSRRTRRSSPR